MPGMLTPVSCLASLPGRYPEIRRWCIAFSGGMDSHVLLSAAVQALPDTSLLALHINHQLQPQASAWQVHCQQVAAQLNVPFKALQVSPSSASEQAAREARYAAFEQVLQPGDGLLMAHHAGDQAETLLFRLCRGTGVAGLAGMPEARPLQQGMLLRPFLALSRQMLQDWAVEQGLQWIEDPSNSALHYDRNYLRLQVLPTLTARWPALVSRLTETAGHMSEAQSLLNEMALADLQLCQERPEVLLLPVLQHLSQPHQHNLLRYWLAGWGVRLSETRLRQLKQQFFVMAENPERELRLSPDVFLRTYRQRLFLCPASRVVEPLDRLLTPEDCSLTLPSGRLLLPDELLQTEQPLRLSYRREGDRIRPAGRQGQRKLSQLFQEAGVPPWLRDSWPIIRDAEGVLWVPGLCYDMRWQKKTASMGRWQPFGLSGEPFFVSLQYHLDPS